MFKADFKNRLEKIFGIPKVTFSAPGDSREQDTLFVEIDRSTSRVGNAQESARVAGFLVMYGQGGKIPFGFFAKKFEQADWDLTRSIFLGVEANEETFGNLVERRVPFTFLYQSQYDPNQGSMTEVQFGDAS